MAHTFVQTNPDVFRCNMQTQFAKLLKDENAGLNIEKGVYNYSIQEANVRQIIKKWKNPLFCQIYIARLRTIYNNLSKNKELHDSVLNGSITFRDFALITHQEMEPSKWKAMMEKQSKRVESQFTNQMEASTDMFTCKKCKSKRCTYYELQTRSADEPATIFVTCLDCGKNWKN